jgi:hypothetical protein
MSIQWNDQNYRRDLGDGLVLRWSSAADLEKIGDLYSYVFRQDAESEPSVGMRLWAYDVGSGRHPLAGPGDFAVVEDTRSGAIAAALMVLKQTWQYEGIPFEIGRPEAVATLPDYRNRGLVRGIFELLHARSAARGQMAQGITGIGYFYRQFGYEYAFELEGSRRVLISALPKLKDGETEKYGLRKATLEDLPVVRELYDREARGACGYETRVSTVFDEAWWRWVFDGQQPDSGQGTNMQLITGLDGNVLGYVMPSRRRWDDTLGIWGVSIAEGASLSNMLPGVLRGLARLAQETTPWRQTPESAEARNITFVMGDSHPIYDALGPNLIARSHRAYAWYVRIPDLPAFIRHITPALERRLVASPLGAYSGELKLDFYRSGLRMVFEQGKLITVEEWRPPTWKPGTSAAFPPLVFLQLMLGRRSLDDLMYAFPDVWANDEPALLLNTLFPKQRSWAIGQD